MKQVFTDLFGNTKDDILDLNFNYWRKRGFPNYKKEDYNCKKELNKLIDFNETTIFKENKLTQNLIGNGFLWTYFPNWIKVPCGGGKSLSELWDDDKKLKELIRKTYDYEVKHGSGVITVNRLRQNSKVYLSKQSVSNFRPTAAKYIYNTYGNNGIVWDMSSGWGGRLFGFLASNCKKYIGTEPNKETFRGLNELKNDFNNIKEVDLINCGSEEYSPIKNSLDLCFTSPPYFDTEKYSEEATQSFIKYQSIDEWVNGFLKKTITNCFNGLKNGGIMAINIANTPKHKTLEGETVRLSEELGFKLIKTIKLELSSISKTSAKYEPIFIFKKEL